MMTMVFSGQGGCGTTPTKKDFPYVFYPPPPDEPRYQYLASYRTAYDIGEKKRSGFADHVLGVEQQEEFLGIDKPYGVAIDDGKIYVCDLDSSVVDVLDLVNKRFFLIGAGPAGRLLKPANIFIDEDGKKYVADTAWNRVLIYDAENQYYGVLGDPEKMKPTDVLIIGDDVLVSDYLDGEIEIWDKNTLEYKGVLGESIGEEIELYRPLSMAKDAQNNIYILEMAAFRVTVLDEEGHFIRTFGKVGDSFGQFARPKGIGVDRDGRVYVIDSAFANVQVFDSEGNLLTFIEGPGGEQGPMTLPAEIAIDYEHIDLFRKYVHPDYDLQFLILVTSQFGPHRVGVYGHVTKKK
jgi:sugar lactone lactonase YvrE